jgi:type 1 fimbria pilin
MKSKVAKLVHVTTLAAVCSFANTSYALDGTVKFTGDIVDAPCVVAPESQDQTINLGQVKKSVFTAAGDKSPRTQFQIKLEECDATVAQNASITFTGLADETNNDLLNVSRGPGATKGVGIEISDRNSAPIALNKPSADFSLVNGQNIIDFGARYVSTVAAVTTGHANGVVDFNFTYK